MSVLLSQARRGLLKESRREILYLFLLEIEVMICGCGCGGRIN